MGDRRTPHPTIRGGIIMAIKKLQNNFTTPEQSKRLLESGVPADSADCYYLRDDSKKRIYLLHDGETVSVKRLRLGCGHAMPSWSVGRLREIFCLCSSVEGTRDYPFCNSQIAWWITEFEFKKEYIDFSKLEE